MASAEGGSVPNGMGYGEGVPSPAATRGLGERRELPRAGFGAEPRPKTDLSFWRIFKATERSLLYLYDKNLRGTICTSVPLLQILGDLSPRPPVIYAHGLTPVV